MPGIAIALDECGSPPGAPYGRGEAPLPAGCKLAKTVLPQQVQTIPSGSGRRMRSVAKRDSRRGPIKCRDIQPAVHDARTLINTATTSAAVPASSIAVLAAADAAIRPVLGERRADSRCSLSCTQSPAIPSATAGA